MFLKPFVAVFKNVANVQSFHIRFESDTSLFAVRFHCRDAVTKNFQLNYESCEVLQAVYSKDRCTNRASMPSKPLHESLANFHTGVEEVTLAAAPSQVSANGRTAVAAPAALLQLGSFEDPGGRGAGAPSVLRTKTSFNAHDLEQFDVPAATSVTFAIKELKAVSAFLEQASALKHYGTLISQRETQAERDAGRGGTLGQSSRAGVE